MKVLFLDFDGVMNSAASFLMENRKREKDPYPEQEWMPVNETLSEVLVSNVQHILDKCPDVKIVISSSWRNLYEMDWLKNKLQSYGLDSSRVIDKTPNVRFSSRRGEEIEAWIEDHPEITNFVILDDDSDMTKKTRKRFLKTTWSDGMTFELAKKAVQMFNGEQNVIEKVNREDETTDQQESS